MLKRHRSRSRSPPPPPWRERPAKSPRHEQPPRGGGGGDPTFARMQSRRNQAVEDAHMRTWVGQEDSFVLQQSVRKAKIRVREDRARPVDHLAVAIGILDPSTGELLEEDDSRPSFAIRDPLLVVNELSTGDLRELKNDLDSWLALEVRKTQRTFWKALRTVCKARLERAAPTDASSRRAGAASVSSDIEKVLAPKTLDQLVVLEKTVRAKLDSDEPLDEEYWEQLLSSIGVHKSQTELSRIFSKIIDALCERNRKMNIADAERTAKRLAVAARGWTEAKAIAPGVDEPEPLLRISQQDESLQQLDEQDFLDGIASDQQKVRRQPPPSAQLPASRTKAVSNVSHPEFSSPKLLGNIDQSSTTNALYNREAARGVDEDEEVFAAEEDVSASKPAWAATHRPRKPRYFNRVQMGYEWNKYNQTHYDYDNPPPKVVQGYKFNIFYPELIDKFKAPTYRIERENGRKRGQSFAPAGEEDTCILRFIAGPPYEDIAFRIVDREWDYSAKRERGFRSSFDKGILQLHFHFKKVYYRK